MIKFPFRLKLNDNATSLFSVGKRIWKDILVTIQRLHKPGITSVYEKTTYRSSYSKLSKELRSGDNKPIKEITYFFLHIFSGRIHMITLWIHQGDTHVIANIHCVRIIMGHEAVMYIHFSIIAWLTLPALWPWSTMAGSSAELSGTQSGYRQ